MKWMTLLMITLTLQLSSCASLRSNQCCNSCKVEKETACTGEKCEMKKKSCCFKA